MFGLDLNYRNRMSQQAQRSSIELFTQLYFKDKSLQTDAYIIKIMAAGLVVLIPQYGIEGMISLPQDRLASGITFDPALSAFVRKSADGTVEQVAGLFQHVQISLHTETNEISQREKLVLDLVSPSLLRESTDGTPPKRTKSS